MKKKSKVSNVPWRRIVPVLVALLMIASVSYLGVKLFRDSKAAAPGTIFVTPSSGTAAPGSTLSLTVREESGTTGVNSVQFFMNYNSAQLQYVSVVEGGVFSAASQTDGNTAGIVRVFRGSDNPVTGEQPVVTVNFKVLAASGSTSVSIDQNNSLLVSNGQNILQTVTGGTYTVSGGTAPSTGVKDATLSLSPASANLTSGGNLTVTVKLSSPNQSVPALQPILVYPTDKLQYVSVSNSATFPSATRTSNNAATGTLDLIRGIAGGGTPFRGASADVVTVTFKVIGTSGSVPITFRNTSGVFLGDGSNILGSTAAGAYAIPTPGTSTPPPPPPPPVTPVPSGGTTPTPSSPPPKTSSSAPISRPAVTLTPQSNGTASLNDGVPEVQGSIDFTPIADPEILAENPGDTITKVEYLLGKKLVSTQNKAPFTFNLDTKKYKNGTYDVTIKTYYQSGAVDISTDKVVVKNPVTLSYILSHYGVVILFALLALAGVGAFLWKVVRPRLFKRDEYGYDALGGGYQGYVGYGEAGTGGDMSYSPDPAVVSPNYGQEQPQVAQTQQGYPSEIDQLTTAQPQQYDPSVQAAGQQVQPQQGYPQTPQAVQPGQQYQQVQPTAQPVQQPQQNADGTAFQPDQYQISDPNDPNGTNRSAGGNGVPRARPF